MQKVKLYNTLTRRKEIFKPIRKGNVGLYTCGPTVYNYAHIGNLRTYIFEDVLRRTLTAAGFRVRHIMNITDVGHLTSDADSGEDKLEKGATRDGKSVWDIAQFYTDAFLRDIAALNIRRADKLIPATATIKDQIALIKKLFAKGYAYETAQAVYFDVSRFKNYTRLSRQKLNEKITGARDEVVTDPEKRHPQDFALWFKRVGKFSDHTMHWPSPWGDGFPGWHIECSAIATKYLGQPFDIHTGGVDHIAVHHTNEIAQSEGSMDKPLARVWMHGEFLLVQEEKMAKSAGNFYTLAIITEKNIDPLAFRYLVLTAHYRSRLNFSWESLAAAEQSLTRLREFTRLIHGGSSPVIKNGTKKEMSTNVDGRQHLLTSSKDVRLKNLKKWGDAFDVALADDLAIPRAFAAVWGLIAAYHKNPEQFNPAAVRRLLLDFDKILGLGLDKIKRESIPAQVKALAAEREQYRTAKNWQKSDELRDQIKAAGYEPEDTSSGVILKKIK
ncbi:MAG: cysteine--tRNA ligase [Candidatus Sungiibacteriota bacterium]